MKKDIEDYLRNGKWKFAKTMPNLPHWYLNAKLIQSEKEYDLWLRAVQEVRTRGVDQRWYGRVIRYLYLDDYKLWTMGGQIYDSFDDFKLHAGRKGRMYQNGYAEFILNIAHVDGLGPNLVDPNKDLPVCE